MKDEMTLKCPKCGAAVPLTESLAAPMVAAVKAEYEARIVREVDAAKEGAVETAKTQAAQQVAKLLAHKDEVANDIARRLTDAEATAAALAEKLTEAQTAQAAAVKRERAIADKERELDLKMELGINQALTKEREHLQREFAEAGKLKLLEKDAQLQAMQRMIDDLKQKAEQGSQQLQGEVQELELEQSLRQKFPHDQVSEVAKGVNGADVTQIVTAPSGAQCGVILWESKRTKRWSDGWLPKLREDGRAAHADLLVVVSAVVPESVIGFDQVDGVWVCEPKYAVPLALLLRESMLRLHAAKQAQAGMATKSELVYAYLTGPQFRHRIEAVVEAFTTMTEDLTAEKKVVTRAWAKREAQIDRVLTSTTGLFGDLQGISGAAIPEIEGMAMAALGAGA